MKTTARQILAEQYFDTPTKFARDVRRYTDTLYDVGYSTNEGVAILRVYQERWGRALFNDCVAAECARRDD